MKLMPAYVYIYIYIYIYVCVCVCLCACVCICSERGHTAQLDSTTNWRIAAQWDNVISIMHRQV